MNVFEDKSASIVIVDGSGPVRQMIAESVRAHGFEKVSTLASGADLIASLESESIDWVLMPLLADKEINALHILSLISQSPELKFVRLSLLVEEDELYVLPAAFELGLLSYHEKPFTKESLPEDLGRFIKVHEENQFQDTLTSATFLRQFLKEQERFSELISFSNNLLEMYPGEYSIFLDIAEAYHKSDEPDEAKKILAQASAIRPDSKEQTIAKLKELFGEDADESQLELDSGVNLLNLSGVCIIDPDEAFASEVEEALTALGAERVTKFTDPNAAWEHIEGNEAPELIITEWQMPNLGGAFLLQRVRQKGLYSTRVIVVSKVLSQEDLPLLKEMGVTTFLKKPCDKDTVLSAIVGMKQQDAHPSQISSMELSIREKISLKDIKAAKEEKDAFLADPKVPMGSKRLIEAEIYYAEKKFHQAKKCLVEAIKNNAESILVLNLLGKTFLALADYESGLKCFKKANEISPQNIERLCSIAEAEVETGEETSQATLDAAAALDPDSITLAEGEAKVAIAAGDTDKAKLVLEQMNSLSNLVSYMNNKAVAHAKCGLISDAIATYEKTIVSIPEDRIDIKAVVNYNLALSFTRHGELKEAIKVLEAVVEIDSAKINAKAKSLMARLKKAVDDGEDFKMLDASIQSLDAESDEEMLDERDFQKMMASIQAQRGDICCFLVYRPETNDERNSKLLKNLPKFKFRGAIERDESLGAEKAMQSA